MMVLLHFLFFTIAAVASSPIMPYYHWDACPCECCTYGNWTARVPVDVRATRDVTAKAKFTLRERETVHALTGLVITRKAGRALQRLTLVGDAQQKPVTVEKGDIIYTLHYLGEGYELIWYRGHTDTLDRPRDRRTAHESSTIPSGAHLLDIG